MPSKFQWLSSSTDQRICYFLALSASLLLNRLLSKRYVSKEKAFIALFFIIITINLFISTGRTGQLAFFVAIFISTLLHFFYSTYKTLPQVETRLQADKIDIVKVLSNAHHYQGTIALTKKALKNPQELSKLRQEFIDNICGTIDGKVSQRIYDLVLEKIQKGKSSDV